MLWIATPRTADDDDFTVGQVRGFKESTLTSSGFSKPDRVLSRGPRLSFGTVGPDNSFYFAEHWDVQSIIRFSPSVLSGTGKGESVSGTGPTAFAFDPSGAVWIHYNEHAEKHPGTVLTRGVLAEPLVKLSAKEDDQDQVTFGRLVFDDEGAMILYRREGLLRIPASELAHSRAVTGAWRPFVSGTLHHAGFDEFGTLWIADENGVVLEISKAQLRGSGPIHAKQHEVAQSVHSVAVDNSNSVWALVRYTGDLYRKKAEEARFTKVGSVGTGLAEDSQLTFNPPPVWSPLLPKGAGAQRL